MAATNTASDSRSTTASVTRARGGVDDGSDVISDSGLDAGDRTGDGGRCGDRRNGHNGRRAPRLRPRHALRGLWLLLMLPLVFAVIAAVGLIGQEVTAPGWIKSRIEEQASAATQGGQLTFGEITLTIGRDLHPLVRLRNAVLTDRDGALLVRVPLIETGFSPRGLILRRELLPQNVHVEGAEIGLRRNADGSVAVALGPGLREGAAPGLPQLLDLFDQAIESRGFDALEEVRFTGLIVNYDDARAGRSWVIDGGTATLDLTGGSNRLSASLGLLSGRSFATTLDFSYESLRGNRAASFTLDIRDAAASDIASQAPALSWLAVLDAPISARIRSGLDAAGELTGFAAELDIGAGALAPVTGAEPIHFSRAGVTLDYDPARARLSFDRLSVISEWGEAQGSGQAFLRDFAGGLPGSILGQFRLSGSRINPAGYLPEPLDLPETNVDLRLGLRPFRIEIAQASVAPAADGSSGAISGRADIAATAEGWSVSVDAQLAEIGVARLIELWPEDFHAPTRRWILTNIHAGLVEDLAFALRLLPGERSHISLSHDFRDGIVTLLRGQPPAMGASGYLLLDGPVFSVTMTGGTVTPPEGGAVDLAGSSFSIPLMTERPPTAVVDLVTQSSIGAALSLLDQPPFRYPSAAGLATDAVAGQARVQGSLRFPLIAPLPADQIDYRFAARLTEVSSATLVPNRRLTASGLDLGVTPGLLTIAGPAQVSGIATNAELAAPFGPGAGPMRVAGNLRLSQAALDAFGIGLPRGMVSGEGRADFALTLPRGAPASYEVTSALAGIGLQIPSLGWSKSPGASGAFAVSGQLGSPPTVDRISLEAAGLAASGQIRLGSAGLDRAIFDRVRLAGWLDAPVTLVGRGAGAAPAVEIRGGVVDLRGGGLSAGGSGSGSGAGSSGPISAALDRLQVTDTIALTGLNGRFQTTGGFAGTFTARVNGGAEVSGTLAPQSGGTAVRLQSGDGGGVLRSAALLANAEGGVLDLTLIPTGAAGSYDGTLAIDDLRVREAPALAQLLNAVSVVGLIQQMAGQGLVFDQVRASFRLDPQRITVIQSSAVGAGLGISLDGFYRTADGNMDFQGVLSPFYLINAVGSVLTRPGEGLIGFNFTLRGPVQAMQVSVNPLSVLTPGMFREIFRRPPPEVGP